MFRIPSRLVLVRRLPAFANGYHVVGADEQRLLHHAGIESHVKFVRGFGAAIYVPEGQADAAREALAPLPDLFPDDVVPSCPRCHARHPAARPPYEMVIVAIGFLGAVGVVLAGWHLAIGYGLVLVSVVSGAIIHSHVPMWRCQLCGCAYGGRSDDRGQVLNFPAGKAGRPGKAGKAG
jgi:hypothetical protein